MMYYAYMITEVTSVQLNVFDVNKGAKKCYLKAGFSEQNTVSNAFIYCYNQRGIKMYIETKRLIMRMYLQT